MSRRKQARPSRLLDDEEEDKTNDKEGDKIDKKKKKDGDNNVTVRTKTEDDANNNNNNDESSKNGNKEEDEEEEEEEEDTEENKATALAIQNLLSNLQWPAASPNVTLEALQNTKVAVAQFAANALAAGAGGENLQDLAVLQSTLFTLQQQQLLQLQLIQQLQQQLHVSNPNSTHDGDDNEDDDEQDISPPNSLKAVVAVPPPTPPHPPPSVLVPNNNIDENNKPENVSKQQQPEQKQMTTSLRSTNMTSSDGLNPAFASLLNCANQDPNRPLSPGLQPQMNSNNDHFSNEDEQPNTLEMLQKRAQEVLDSASQGLLASSLADDPRKKLGPYEKGREPFFKHRCRYCGKVFGSDSALQIHIRSHTGERPFKCNVCGSRFTTKGNLKVHFQRHTSKFPHIKMNPHPVPEHLDHFHPPLLSTSNTSSTPTTPEHSPNSNHQVAVAAPIILNTATSTHQGGPPPPPPLPFSHPTPFHPFSPLFRFDVKHPFLLTTATNNNNNNNNSNISNNNHHHLNNKILQDNDPQDLTKPKIAIEKEKQIFKEEKVEDEDEEERTSPKLEQNHEVDENEDEEEPPQEEQQQHKQQCQVDDEEEEEDNLVDENSQDQPENLSSKSLPLMFPLPLMAHRPSRPSSASSSSCCLPPRSSDMLRYERKDQSPPLPNPLQQRMSFDPAKDPAIYTNLLPRPGSNDNAWESLIEVTKTSETSKLQQLVDNIEHKLTDPNQCIICHRVLSCKSALQMHYRTHTGERPFKCKICGRAFTTKGNLKTHMQVHRAKPPLRVLHQCPVCHKRFTNSLVLQQHIRLHTGEPTDLTPDQIRAAEVKDPYPSFSGFPPPGFPHFLNSSLHLSDDQQIKSERGDDEDDEDDDDVDDNDINDEDDENNELNDMSDNEESNNEAKPTTSLAALENQVRTITTTFASQMLVQNQKQQEAEDLTKSRNNISINNNNNNSTTTNGRSSEENNLIESCSDDTSDNVNNSVANSPFSRTPPLNNNFALDLRNTSSSSAIFNPFGHHLPSHSHHHPAHHHHHHTHHLVHHPSLLAPPPLASLANLTSPPFSPNIGPPRQFGDSSDSFLWTARGNTTCQICLKTFACNSALEIHYRSHTKERPFKCNICERGFSTKGNMKQHMLTHKIRDMPATSNSSFDSNKANNGMEQSDDNQSSNQGGNCSPESPALVLTNKRPPSSSDNSIDTPPPHKKPHTGLPCEEDGGSGGGGGGGSSSSSSKHICKVCTKNFSSSSALHIHLRTHTGDRPFRCTVCQKAFTTKGNLKVHMGTHLWTNGVSRRGRRMSLDPLSVFLPIAAPNQLLHHHHHQQHHQQQQLLLQQPTQQPLSGTINNVKEHHHQQLQHLIQSEGHHRRRPTELFYPYAQTLAAPIFPHNNHNLTNGSLHVNDDDDNDEENEEVDEQKKKKRKSNKKEPVLEVLEEKAEIKKKEEQLLTA